GGCAGFPFQNGSGPGGAGGLYGGGGSGSGDTADGVNTAGNGAQGIIVITYKPASATTIIVDAPVIFEFLTSQTPGTVTPIDFRASQHNDLPTPYESTMSAQYVERISAEFLAMSRSDGWLPFVSLATANGASRIRSE